MEQVSQNKMGTENLTKLIINMSLPAMFSMLIQALYNIVDSIFVAQLGENALTAISLAFPIQMLMISVAVGTSVGLNSLISRKLGQKDIDGASNAADHGIILGIFSGALFAVFGIFFAKMYFEAFTNNQEIINHGFIYTSIVTILSFGVFIQINVQKTLQATGDMIYPMLFQLSGAVINIILDPILIFGLFGVPKMGMAGAAIATVIGQIVAMSFSLYILYTKNHEIHISFKGFKINWSTVKSIYAVGFPAIIMQSIGSVLIIGLNTILISFSQSAVAVLGVYFKVQSFIFMPVFGLTQGTISIMGYNYGAKNIKRLMKTLKISMIIAIGIMIFGTVLFNVIPKQLLMMFNASEEMLKIGIPALRIISVSFVGAAIGFMISTLFQAIGQGMKSLYISILRQLVFILPIAWIMAKCIGLSAVWYAFPISEVFGVIASVIMLMYVYKNNLVKLEATSL